MMEPEVILHQLDFFKPLVDRAIRITESYIAEHKLLLTGGKAIDLALRLKDQHIYGDDVLADYDIISDEYLHHASALAEILCKDGLPDINVIGAIHINTVRVRMKNTVLLDATYVPSELYKKIPHLDTGDLRTVHPHYQLIDQRESLSKLMVDTGRSLSVFRRLMKDIYRNLLLRELYPISSPTSSLTTTTVSIPLDLIRVDHSKLEQVDEHCFFYTGKACLAGAVGVAIMMAFEGYSSYELTQDSLIVKVPEGLPVRFLTCDMAVWQFTNPKKYRPLLQLKPATVRDGNYEYVDTLGSRLGCYTLDLKSVTVCIASVDYLLMELLRDRIFTAEEPFTTMYLQLAALVDKKRSQADSDAIWWPSLNCYGRIHLPESRLLAMEKIIEPMAKSLKPKNVYLRAQCNGAIKFDLDNSHYFKLDGRQDDTLEHTNYAYIRDRYIQLLKTARGTKNPKLANTDETNEMQCS